MQLNVAYLLDRARQQLASRQNGVAEHYLQAILAQEPRHVEALSDLARIAMQAGKPDKALGYGRRILSTNRKTPLALGHLLVGNALRAQGDHRGAVRAYREVVKAEPNHGEALCNLGGCLVDLRLWDEALGVLQHAVAILPNDSAILANLGLALQQAGLIGQAIDALRRAIELQPNFPTVWLTLGSLVMELGRLPEAAHAFQQAAAMFTDPLSVGVAQYNLALVLIQQDRRRDALVMLALALEKNPDLAIAEGAMLYQAQWLCHWDMVDYVAPRVLQRMRSNPAMVVEPFSALAIPGATNQDHALASAAYARRIMPAAAPLVPRGHRWNDGRSRLRVGFLCADFRDHPMGVLMAGMLANLDRTKIEPVALTYGVNVDDKYRRRCLSACEMHLDLNETLIKSEQSAAEAVAALQLDVLVDLQCYTSGTRSGLLRYRPAPVHGHYLVYPTSAAAPEVYDFTILDDVMCPVENEAGFTEKVLRFRGSYFPLVVPDRTSHELHRHEEGLPEAACVFVSMSQTYKISRETFHVWCSILAGVPGSVLWIAQTPPEAAEILRNTMRVLGLDPARLVIAVRAPGERHAARLRLADIGLDTWPYGSHTTAMDLLSNHVPIVTIMGNSNPCRVASSILLAAGLDELVQADVEGFVATAIRLGTDEAFATLIRHKVRSVFDGDRNLAGIVEQAVELGDILCAASVRSVNNGHKTLL